MKRAIFNQYIEQANWQVLFITEMGWNRPQGQNLLPTITIDDTDYCFSVVAQRNGFQILTCNVACIPNMSTCRKIDLKLRRQANDYIAIFCLSHTVHHLWACPLKINEKRDIVVVEYTTAEQAAFLYSKMDAITFELDDITTIIDVRQHVAQAFAVNSEKITQNFYNSFRKQHKEFAGFITGIDDDVALYDNKKQELNRNKLWYASVMLNRLMFCYFIQKKGFLDGDVDYLSHKLQHVQAEEGNESFYSSFYREFLVSLFHDGLNAPHHTPEWERRFGRIPYLNGGMFDLHTIERQYADIDIADEAFASLFAFFDTWQWHLDTRITASGNDINPDVLGYIFEQYINDRAAMGAYYTKEDITEYISKNCILPWLFDRVEESSSRNSFVAEGEVWQWLKQSGDKYIYDAVKRGYTTDWEQLIPKNIACGLDTAAPDLLDRRKNWNLHTSEHFALPTEIWRETIERLQRCDMLIAKIASGEITHINDFITLNLDIRSFAYDLLARTTDHKLVANFYHALTNITILDPTCGSGAFLFAALGILEPLYEVCILRMQEWNAEKPNLFKSELGEIVSKYRSNIQYFIYKSIILRNLYGVDIMVEATEIAKLRLFLKMVAVVEVDRRADNMGLDPLPDIDFNIRCGNTLVGYATEQQLEKDLVVGDMFANLEFREKIEESMRIVSTAYEIFRQVQLTGEDDRAEYAKAKKNLRCELANLNDLLSRHMFASCGGDDYATYLSTHQPFHWLAEFYNVIHGNGGFDVVIGNPPYVEYNKKDPQTKKAISDCYKINDYKTESCGNLYAFVLERCKTITKANSYIGMIVPLSGHSTERMAPLVNNFYKTYGLRLHLNLSADAHPQKLFEGVKFRLCIFFVSNAHKGHFSTKYTRWYAEEREILFKKINYFEDDGYSYGNVIGKIPSPLIISALNKMRNKPFYFFCERGNNKCLYHNAPVNWIRSHSFIPYFRSERDGEGITTQLKIIPFDNQAKVKIGSALINSSLFFVWWLVNSDCYHLNKPEITEFKYKYPSSTDSRIIILSDELAKDMLAKCRRRVYVYKTSGRVEYDEFYMKLSKPIIDEIDKVLAQHYGFTDEELDFIINYDIKYRMGDELNSN